MKIDASFRSIGPDDFEQFESLRSPRIDHACRWSDRFPLLQYLGSFVAVLLVSIALSSPALAQDDVDSDADGVMDVDDNCPDVPNPDQQDTDRDTVGDACDNAPEDANPGQEDSDADRVGDAVDNCPDDPNPEQNDMDEDGIGDACDNDDDGDWMDDTVDNCPIDANPMQKDDDFDGLGNACDPAFNESDVIARLVEDVKNAVEIIVLADFPGGNHLIYKLTGRFGVLQKVSHASVALESGRIGVHTYRHALRRALDRLDAFDRKLSAIVSDGRIDPADDSLLMDASDEIRAKIETLIAHAETASTTPPPGHHALFGRFKIHRFRHWLRWWYEHRKLGRQRHHFLHRRP